MQVLILLQNMEILHPQLQLVRRPERRRRNIPLIRNDDGLEQKRVTNHERRRWRRVEAVKDELELCLHLRHDSFEDVVEGVRGSTEVRDQGKRYVVMFCFGGN